MAQQVNLSSPDLQVAPQRFAAQTLAIMLGVLVVLGGSLGGFWVWKLAESTAQFRQTADMQQKEISSLKAVAEAIKVSAAPVDPALLHQVQTTREQLAQRVTLKQVLLDGRFQPGWGHSDRLQLVSRSIPDPVWVTEVKADASRLEVAGFTLEPAALNQWVTRLSASPLMQGLQLATVQVENTAKTTGGAANVTTTPALRPQWSFTLVSAQPVLPGPAASAPGGKP